MLYAHYEWEKGHGNHYINLSTRCKDCPFTVALEDFLALFYILYKEETPYSLEIAAFIWLLKNTINEQSSPDLFYSENSQALSYWLTVKLLKFGGYKQFNTGILHTVQVVRFPGSLYAVWMFSHYE